MKKNTIRLNESQLRQIVKESVKRVLNEGFDIDDDNYYGGGLPDSYYDDGYTETPNNETEDIEDSQYFDEICAAFEGIDEAEDTTCKKYYKEIQKYLIRISRGVETAIKRYNIPKDVIKQFLQERHPMYIRLQETNPYICHL